MASIADKLRKLYNQKPVESEENDDELEDGTRATGIRSSVEVQPMPASKRLRLRAAPPMPMEGKKVERKDVEQDDEESDNSDAPSEKENDEMKGYVKASSSTAPPKPGSSITLRRDIEEEVSALEKKQPLQIMASSSGILASTVTGDQVTRQVKFLRSLQGLRIEIQQSLQAAHKLPQKEDYPHNLDMDALHSKAWLLFERLTKLQNKKYGPARSTLQLPKLSKKRDREGNWINLEQRNDKIFQWSLDIFDEYKEKTKLEARKGFKVLDQSFASQLNKTMADNEWRKKCHPNVENTEVIGGSITKIGEDRLIYNDRDFYTSMLKEIMSGNSITGTLDDNTNIKEAVSLSKRQVKKLREREVERRASKGRKIRYKVHEKLQNFMAPVKSVQMESHVIDQYVNGLFR